MINENHFEERLNKEITESGPEGLKDENLEIFNEFISAIDGIKIEKAETALPGGLKYSIEPHPETVTVVRGTLKHPATAEKTATRLRIIIAPNFSTADVPVLIKEIEEYHNKSEETQEGGMVLNVTRSISESYLFWAKQLNAIAIRIPETVRPRFNEYINKLVALAISYDAEILGNRTLESLNDNDFSNISMWTKSIEGKKALERWTDFINGPMNEYRNRPERLERMMDLIDTLVVAPNVKESLDYNLTQTIFEKGEKEMWQLSDISEIFKREFRAKGAREFFKSHFVEEWNALDDMRHRLSEAKERGNVKEISRLQKEIAERVMMIIDSGKFWEYKRVEYKISKIPKKRQINCMARTAIIHNVLREFFDEETLIGITADHSFPVLKLADGSLYAIDKSIFPQRFSDDPENNLRNIDISRSPKRHYIENNQIYFENHEKGYQSAIWDWLMAPNSYKFVFEQACKLTPNLPNLYTNLVYCIDRSIAYPGKEKDLEKVILKTLGLVGNNPLVLTVAGNFYTDFNPRKAIEYYEKALDIMDKYPGLDNNWSIFEIEAKIKEAKTKIKKE